MDFDGEVLENGENAGVEDIGDMENAEVAGEEENAESIENAEVLSKMEELRAELAESEAALSLYRAETEAARKRMALFYSLAGKAFDPADIVGRIDLGAVSIGENGQLLEDGLIQIEAIKAKKPYLFIPERAKEADISGAKPAGFSRYFGRDEREYVGIDKIFGIF